MVCPSGSFQSRWGAASCDGISDPSTRLGAVVQKEMILDMPLEEYDADAIRSRLARVYGLSADMISLEVRAGSLQVIVTFHSSPITDANSSVNHAINGSMPSMSSDAIMMAVTAVDDVTLASILRANVTSLNVTSLPPVKTSAGCTTARLKHAQ